MATLVVEQPDDVLCVAVSEHNPYKDASDRLCDEERHPVYFGQTLVRIPSQLIVRAHELEEFGRSIRLVTLLDMVMCCINFIFTGHLLFIAAAALNFAGYWGTIRFNRVILCIYVVYQWLASSSKITYVVMTPTGSDSAVSTTLILSAVFNMFMSVFVMMFMRRIPT